MSSVALREHGASRGALAMMASFGVVSLFSYAFAVVLSWMLPVAAYGIVGVLQAVLLIGSTAVNSGIPWALAHRISREPEFGVSRAYLATATTGNALFGALLGGLIVAWMEWGWPGLGNHTTWAAAIVAGTVILYAITAVFTSTLQGFLRLGAFGVVRALDTIVRFGMAVLLVAVGLGVVGATAGFLIGATVALIWAVIAMRGLPVTHSRRQTKTVASDYRSVGSFLVVMICLAGLTYADLIGVKVFSPAAVAAVRAGHYQAVVAVSRIPVFLTLSVFTAIFPYAARESSHQAPSIGYARLSVKFLVLLMIPIGLVFALMPEQVMAFFFPAKYAVSAGPLAVSGVAVMCLCGLYAWSLLLQATGRFLAATTVLPATLAAEFAALALLVPRLGVLGAALSLALTAGASLAMLIILGQPALRLRVTMSHAARYLLSLGVLAIALVLCPHGGRVVTVLWLIGAAAAYLGLLAWTRLLTRADVSTLAGGMTSGIGRHTPRQPNHVDR